jgi:2-oxoglutarate ferredoxin oxidoreductase subunit beta
MHAEVVPLDSVRESDLLLHDETNDAVAFLLASLAWQPQKGRAGAFPVPLGVLRAVDRPLYEQRVHEQISAARGAGAGSFDDLFASGDTWVVQ